MYKLFISHSTKNDVLVNRFLDLLFNGMLGCQQNLYKAINLYKQAIERGCVNSCTSIGEILADYENAIKWYKEAVNHGDTASALRLGKIFKDGYGYCPQDKTKLIAPDFAQSIHYLHIAAVAGESDAWNLLYRL